MLRMKHCNRGAHKAVAQERLRQLGILTFENWVSSALAGFMPRF